MASRIWNESGRVWEDDHGLLDETQMARCIRADEIEFKSPVPTRMISNGEYMPAMQTEKQARVEQRIGELADGASRKLSLDRRTFLAGSGGMAAAFVAMNEVPQPPLLENTATMRPFFFGASTCLVVNSETRSSTVCNSSAMTSL